MFSDEETDYGFEFGSLKYVDFDILHDFLSFSQNYPLLGEGAHIWKMM